MTTTTTTITKEFRIPAENMDNLTEQIEQLNKRAKRLHCSPITVETLDIERDVDDDGVVTLFYHVRISGVAPRINGWTFVAVVEHLSEEGNLIRAVPDMLQDGELAHYRNADPICEHCGVNRRRNNTYILKSDNGVFKQVGKQCLVDFTGHDNPMAIAHNAEFFALASEACESCEDDLLDGFGGHRSIIDLESYLYFVHACIREDGWISRQKAQETMTLSTADSAMSEMANSYRELQITEKDREATKKALEWIRGGDWNASNDYLYNLYVVCKGVILSPRHSGISASLFAAYNKAMEVERERKQAAATSEWQGKVGKRDTYTLTCHSVHYSEGMYGTTAIYKLTDADGNQFTWFSSSDVLEAGNTYTLKATVKSHDEYRGVKQTVITRCKVQ